MSKSILAAQIATERLLAEKVEAVVKAAATASAVSIAVALTRAEAAVALKIIRACHSMPCSIDEFAGLTNEEIGYDEETGEGLGDCPLDTLHAKLEDAQ